MKLLEKRDYQVEAPGKVVESLRKTLKALIVMATGLGKTITCGLTIQEYFKNTKSFRVLYLCDRNLALDQAEKEFFEKLDLEMKPARLYGSNQASTSRIGKSIVFASFQKLSSAREWYKQFKPDHFDLIVVDEAHHAFAPTYHSIIQYFQSEPCPIIGMTATPYRADQKDIKDLFGPAVVDISLEEGIAMGWLADLEYQIMSDDFDEWKLQRIIDTEFSRKGVKKPSVKSLNTRLFIKRRDDEIVKQIKFHSQKGMKTLIFCQSIAQANIFRGYFGSMAKSYHSGHSKEDNKKSLEEFKDGPIKYLLVVDKLNEAFDMPEVELVVFLRTTDSLRIFLQQLGRGLRKTFTKRKVLVLDFVSNCERLMYIATLANKIKELSDQNYDWKNTESYIDPGTVKNQRIKNTKEEGVIYTIEGKSFTFAFTHKVVKMMTLLKMIREGFYPTWQEASVAAQKLGIKSSKEYRERYKDDPRLPVAPDDIYSDFPGMGLFLGTSLYPIWQEASKAAQKLGIKDWKEYQSRYNEDSRLPSTPNKCYPNFPGMEIFLETNKYPTWQEASVAAQKLGIKDSLEYRRNYKQDSKLPCSPNTLYSNFPGFRVFLGNDVPVRKYTTWQRASRATIKLGIKNREEYDINYKKDPRLPSGPHKFYDDYPGADIFFGNLKYSTWRRASKVVKGLGINTILEYRASYKKDPKLPSNPSKTYPDFPGWLKFLGKKK